MDAHHQISSHVKGKRKRARLCTLLCASPICIWHQGPSFHRHRTTTERVPHVQTSALQKKKSKQKILMLVCVESTSKTQWWSHPFTVQGKGMIGIWQHRFSRYHLGHCCNCGTHCKHNWKAIDIRTSIAQFAEDMPWVGLVAGTDRTSHVYWIDALCFLY